MRHLPAWAFSIAAIDDGRASHIPGGSYGHQAEEQGDPQGTPHLLGNAHTGRNTLTVNPAGPAARWGETWFTVGGTTH